MTRRVVFGFYSPASGDQVFLEDGTVLVKVEGQWHPAAPIPGSTAAVREQQQDGRGRVEHAAVA